MTDDYFDSKRHALVLRTAPTLAGPWGEEQIAVTAEKYPRHYASYITPVSDLKNDVYSPCPSGAVQYLSHAHEVEGDVRLTQRPEYPFAIAIGGPTGPCGERALLG